MTTRNKIYEFLFLFRKKNDRRDIDNRRCKNLTN